MKYIKVSKFDNSEMEVTLEEVIDKTEGCGYWEQGTVADMLAEGQEVWTPYSIYKMCAEREVK